jgi:hypothetical protein
MANRISDEAFYKVQRVEISLRGKYMRFSANVEGLLMRNIFFLNEEKFLATNFEDPIRLKGLMFHKKIEKFQELLKELHPDMETKYADLFDHLSNFKEMRNKMAHCYFKWNETDLSTLTIWDIKEASDKIQFFEPTTHNVDLLFRFLNNSISNITERFNELSIEIEEAVRHKMPYLFDVLESGNKPGNIDFNEIAK